MPKKASAELRFAVLAADIALFTVRDAQLLVRVVSVNRPPYFTDTKGLPGGLIRPSETAEAAAHRLIDEKAQVDSSKVYTEQLATFSAVERDPRGRVVAVGYLALVPWDNLTESERTDTPDAWWCDISDAAGFAYDHDEMLEVAKKRLRSRLTYTTLASKLMPAEFTLTDLERVYGCVLDRNLDKRNFRKKILKLDILKAVPRKRSGGQFRPAQLYRFTTQKLMELNVL